MQGAPRQLAPHRPGCVGSTCVCSGAWPQAGFQGPAPHSRASGAPLPEGGRTAWPGLLPDSGPPSGRCVGSRSFKDVGILYSETEFSVPQEFAKDLNSVLRQPAVTPR